MTDSNSAAVPLPSNDKSGKSGSRQEVRWQVVAEAPGITPATIIAGRLQAEGIPVRAWQESAGQALGLTVGLLGTGYVAVPEEFADQALEILGYEEEPEDWDEEEWDEEFEEFDDEDE